jgi:hypothetical protein
MLEAVSSELGIRGTARLPNPAAISSEMNLRFLCGEGQPNDQSPPSRGPHNGELQHLPHDGGVSPGSLFSD